MRFWKQETGNRSGSGNGEPNRSPNLIRFLFPVSWASLVTLCLFAVACAPKSVDDYHTAENDEQIVRLLNDREYGKAIFLIESRDGKQPADKREAFLLGQAYLGKAGLEPLAVAAKVGAAQNFSSAEAQAIFPSCSDAALQAVREADPLCLLKRVYFQVPDADLYEMSRARALFRYAYPDAAASPEWVNVLVGALETATVIKRIGSLFLAARGVLKNDANPSDDQLRWVARQLRLILDDAGQAIARADHAGNRISQLLTGSQGAVWFERAAKGIHWAEKMGIDRLFDGLRGYVVNPDGEAKYGEMLDKIRAYLDEQDQRLASVK